MISFRRLASIITASLSLLLIMASLFGKYRFEGTQAIWYVLLLAVAMMACFRYLRDFRLNLVLIMSFFIWMGLILRLAVIQTVGNVDALVQYGDFTAAEYNQAALYICLACGMSLLGIVLAGKSLRSSPATMPTRVSRLYLSFVLILAFSQLAQFFYLYFMTQIMNQLTTYRPDELIGKVLAYFRSEFFVMSLFAVALWVIRPLDPDSGQRWRSLGFIQRSLLLVVLIAYAVLRLVGGNRGFLFEVVLQMGFATLAVYNLGELSLRLNLKRVSILALVVYLSSLGWFVVEQIRTEVFYSEATLSSLNWSRLVRNAAAEYDFSYFLGSASARVYLLDPAVLPLNDAYYISPDTLMSYDQSLKRSVNRIVPLNSIKPFDLDVEESELAYHKIYHFGIESSRQSYTAPGLAYITFGWWGGLVLMFAVSYLTARVYQYVLHFPNPVHSVIFSSLVIFFYYEWWQTFGFDNLAYKMVWTTLTLGGLMFCFHLFWGRHTAKEPSRSNDSGPGSMSVVRDSQVSAW